MATRITRADLTGAELYTRDNDDQLVLVGWIADNPVTDEIPVKNRHIAFGILTAAGYDTVVDPRTDPYGFGWSDDGSGFARLVRG